MTVKEKAKIMSNAEEKVSAFHYAVLNVLTKDACDLLQVGWAPDGGESTGHESGRIIVELLQKDEDEYDEDDLKHMSKVTSYVHRHSAQGPSKGDVETSKWRYSLMNW